MLMMVSQSGDDGKNYDDDNKYDYDGDDEYDDDDNVDNFQAWPTFHPKICSKTQLNSVTGKAPSFNVMMTMMILMTTMTMTYFLHGACLTRTSRPMLLLLNIACLSGALWELINSFQCLVLNNSMKTKMA